MRATGVPQTDADFAEEMAIAAWKDHEWASRRRFQDIMTARPEFLDRKRVVWRLKEALERRSGKRWSVTGGTGTAYGWITVSCPPKERVEFGYMPEARCMELAKLMGLERVHNQGLTIPAGHDFYRLYWARAEFGHSCGLTAEPSSTSR